MARIIRITARRDGFRRAGLAHPGAPTDHPADRFSKEQLRELKAEPMLVVQEIDAPDEKPAEGGTKTKGSK